MYEKLDFSICTGRGNLIVFSMVQRATYISWTWNISERICVNWRIIMIRPGDVFLMEGCLHCTNTLDYKSAHYACISNNAAHETTQADRKVEFYSILWFSFLSFQSISYVIQASLLLCDFCLHNFALMQFETLHHFSNLRDCFNFNMIWHRSYLIILVLTWFGIDDLWRHLSCLGG